jgi:hypothetical protein
VVQRKLQRLQKLKDAAMHRSDQNLLVFSAAIGLLGLVAYYVLSMLYYRHLHPLSSFPGPEKAASSRSWIYRVTDGGFPEEELERLHKKYRSYHKSYTY